MNLTLILVEKDDPKCRLYRISTRFLHIVDFVSPTTGSKTDIDYQITRDSAKWYHVCARNVLKINNKMKKTSMIKNKTLNVYYCTRFLENRGVQCRRTKTENTNRKSNRLTQQMT